MDGATLQIVWFLLFGVLVIGYAILDGFDLGVGLLTLVRGDPGERRLMVNAIAPVWDGNEVWLLTAGGALFAAFPIVYATAFSAFYLAFVLLLVALVFRAVSMEFRHLAKSAGMKAFWDRSLGLSSLVPALLFGVAVGNIMRGIPLDENHLFTGNILGHLNPYAVGMGLLSLTMFTAHGALYMAMKSEDALADGMKAWAARSWVAWVALYVVMTVATVFVAPHLFEGALGTPISWLLMLLLLGGLCVVPFGLRSGRTGWAFLGSSAAIAAQVGLVGAGLFPRLVPSLTNLEYSLTITNGSYTERALTTMLVIALIGLPMVLVYTFFIYRIFKGKVRLDEHSY